MEYFSGSSSITADEKGRYRVPSKYRAKFGTAPIYILKNSDRYLSIISDDKAKQIIEKLSPLIGITDNETSDSARVLLTSMFEIKEDSQGRFSIPPEMKKEMGFDKEVVFAGVATKLEMWSKEKWEENQAEVALKAKKSEILSSISF